MRFCFILEEQYRGESMPRVVADQLLQWGHNVDILEPHAMVMSLSDLGAHGYDAYILKTVSDGPGLHILEAVEAAGIPTINRSCSIRLVRNKAVAAAYARAHGFPMPATYFVTHLGLLQQIPTDMYPLIVKPNNGSSARDIHLLRSPKELASIEAEISRIQGRFFLAQRYAENPGYDIKMYVIGEQVYAVAKKSPLHGAITETLLPVTPELSNMALSVGRLFGLDIYGLDLVETPQGLALLDINDFPSFGMVPQSTVLIAKYILHLAARHKAQRQRATALEAQRQRVLLEEIGSISTKKLPALVEETR